jgi:hypothetical protein
LQFDIAYDFLRHSSSLKLGRAVTALARLPHS